MDMDLIYSVAAFLIAVVLMTIYTRRKQKSHWRGSVTHISHFNRSQHDSDDEDSVTITKQYVKVKYQNETGKKGKLVLKQAQYDALFPKGLQVGDTLVKKPGEYYPGIE
jgi:uncharacterized membrane protein